MQIEIRTFGRLNSILRRIDLGTGNVYVQQLDKWWQWSQPLTLRLILALFWTKSVMFDSFDFFWYWTLKHDEPSVQFSLMNCNRWKYRNDINNQCTSTWWKFALNCQNWKCISVNNTAIYEFFFSFAYTFQSNMHGRSPYTFCIFKLNWYFIYSEISSKWRRTKQNDSIHPCDCEINRYGCVCCICVCVCCHLSARWA